MVMAYHVKVWKAPSVSVLLGEVLVIVIASVITWQGFVSMVNQLYNIIFEERQWENGSPHNISYQVHKHTPKHTD